MLVNNTMETVTIEVTSIQRRNNVKKIHVENPSKFGPI